MKKFIKGKRYNFLVGLSLIQNNYYFSIEAIDEKRKTYSCINNLNYILSALEIEEDDEKYWESEWRVTKSQGKRFFKELKNFLAMEDAF